MDYDREALLRELEGYERAGKTDRAKAVRALLGLDAAPVEQATAAPGERRATRRRD